MEVLRALTILMCMEKFQDRIQQIFFPYPLAQEVASGTHRMELLGAYRASTKTYTHLSTCSPHSMPPLVVPRPWEPRGHTGAPGSRPSGVDSGPGSEKEMQR
jgi:hypothetical protein